MKKTLTPKTIEDSESGDDRHDLTHWVNASRKIAKNRPLFGVDIVAHHTQCEMNFHQFVKLLPGLRSGQDSWAFNAGVEKAKLQVYISVLESAPYTTTLSVEQNHHFSQSEPQSQAQASLSTPRIVVRLYHDVNMAEIISWDHHRRWKPQYAYPNINMYQPDEKFALDRFLGDWLAFCRKQGLLPHPNVMQFN